MALKAIIYKATLKIADMDRHYYRDHTLTIARHPSETDERMMVRLLAFVCQAHETLEFGKGISNDEEPDLWRKNLVGEIEQWIEIGQPDDRRLLKASSRAEQVMVYSFTHVSEVWWRQIENKISRAKNISVWRVAPETSQALVKLAARTMLLQCTIQEGHIWISNEHDTVQVEMTLLRAAK